ncbi:hypothetical protein [Wolbachia endosymbiont of Brugia pahangi]|uniref:hypothetical protein n=1 Tax=Wolbachia endosymbiont of Brugia pahangi TaxID=96495 RepID=UPI00350FE08E
MANSLVEAKKRGVDIKIILDKSQHIQNIVLCTSYLKKEYQFGLITSQKSLIIEY